MKFLQPFPLQKQNEQNTEHNTGQIWKGLAIFCGGDHGDLKQLPDGVSYQGGDCWADSVKNSLYRLVFTEIFQEFCD